MANEIRDAFNTVFADGPTGSPSQPVKSRIRQEVGAVIQQQVDAKASSADLTTAMDDEKSERETADTALGGRIDSVEELVIVNANVYDSTAAGLAATTNGQQFQVISSDVFIRYRNNAGVAVEVSRTDMEPFRKRGNLANGTDLGTIVKPGLYWLAANGGYLSVPTGLGYAPTDSYYLEVMQAGGASGPGNSRWILQRLIRYSLSLLDPTNLGRYRMSWSRTLDANDPGSTSGTVRWVRDNPEIQDGLLATNYNYRGSIANADFNALTKAGAYTITSIAANGPIGMVSGLLTVENRATSVDAWMVQTLVRTDDPTSGWRRIMQSTSAIQAWKPLRQGPACGKRIVTFGDSIWDNGGGQRIQNHLARLLCSQTYNIGMGGTRMAQHGAGWDGLSMYQISGCIASGDWQPLIDAADAVYTSSGGASDYRAKAAEIAAIDWSTVDIITVPYGRNDKTGNNPIGTNADTTGATYKGAMNKIVADIQGTYPHIQIVWISPLYSTDGANANGATMRDFADAMAEIAGLYNCQFIDLQRVLGVNSGNFDFYMQDTSHPRFGSGTDYNTNLRIAEIIAGAMSAPGAG